MGDFNWVKKASYEASLDMITPKQISFLQKHTELSEEKIGQLSKRDASLVITSTIRKWEKF